MQSFLAKRAFPTVFRAPALRAFTTKPLEGKEKGDEKVFFNKEDEKVLKNLIKKMEIQNEQAKKLADEAPKHSASLSALFKKHGLDEVKQKAFFEELVNWKKQL